MYFKWTGKVVSKSAKTYDPKIDFNPGKSRTTVQGWLMETHFTHSLPFDAAASSGFSMEVIHESEFMPVVWHATTDMSDLTLSIEFDPAELVGAFRQWKLSGRSPNLRNYSVCCNCNGCSQCIECENYPPSPHCGCPGCSVTCH